MHPPQTPISHHTISFKSELKSQSLGSLYDSAEAVKPFHSLWFRGVHCMRFLFFLIYLGHAALEPKTIFYKEESQSMATWSGRSSFILPFKPPTIFRLMASTDFHILLSYNIIIFLDSVMVNNFPWFSFLLLYARIVCLTTGLYL